MSTASAPGKIILLGEHSVVYGRPAIAVPVWNVQATADVQPQRPGRGCTLSAPQLDRSGPLAAAPVDDPLALVTRLALAALGAPADPDLCISVHSAIPIAGGLGSGAAISAALVAAIFAHYGAPADPAQVSALVFESERIHHGTPSGIDNTVIAYGRPVWFVKGQPPQLFTPAAPFTLAIADSGITAPTKETVGDVRRGWQNAPARYERWFDKIAELVVAARTAVEQGEMQALGPLLNANQALLARLGVSSPPLEHLIAAARRAGAAGAKLSGGGRGGNIIALVTAQSAPAVEAALLQAGARRVIVTHVGAQAGLVV